MNQHKMFQLLALFCFLIFATHASAQSYCTATEVQAEHLSFLKTINERLAEAGFPPVTLVSELSQIAARKLSSLNMPPNTNSTCGLNPKWGWTDPLQCCGLDMCSYCFEKVLARLHNKHDTFSKISITQVPLTRSGNEYAPLTSFTPFEESNSTSGNYTYVGLATFNGMLVEVYSRNTSDIYTPCAKVTSTTTSKYNLGLAENETSQGSESKPDIKTLIKNSSQNVTNKALTVETVVVESKQYVFPYLYIADVLVDNKPLSVERYERGSQAETNFCEYSSGGRAAATLPLLITAAMMTVWL